MARTTRKADFIEVMECLPVTTVPDGPDWTYEIKLDGYRMEAVKCRGDLTLYSRRKNSLNHRFDSVASALKGLPDETVIDGELVALGPGGKPSFNLASEPPFSQVAHDLLRIRHPLPQRRRFHSTPSLEAARGPRICCEAQRSCGPIAGRRQDVG